MLWEGRTHRSSRFSLSRHTEIVFVVVTSSTVGCLEVIVAARTVLLPPNGHRAKGCVHDALWCGHNENTTNMHEQTKCEDSTNAKRLRRGQADS